MGNTTVNGALLLAGLMLFAGSVFSLNADGFGRRVLKPNDVFWHKAREYRMCFFGLQDTSMQTSWIGIIKKQSCRP